MLKIPIAIFEDDPQFREGLSWLLATEPRFVLTGRFAGAENLLEDLRAVQPQIVLMDVMMPPGPNGLEALLQIRQAFPEIQVIMLTGNEDEEVIFGAIRGGASGYLLKEKAASELIEAIFSVAEGGSPMTPRVAKKVLAFFQVPPKSIEPTNLTPRETEILRSLTKGHSHKMIAAELHIAIDTVRNHLRKIYEKLQVHSMTEAVAKALGDRLI